MNTRLYREDLGLLVELTESRTTINEIARVIGVKRRRVLYLRELLGCQTLQPGHSRGLLQVIPELLARRRMTTAELLEAVGSEWGSVSERTVYRACVELIRRHVIERVGRMTVDGYYRLREAKTSLGTKR